MAKWFPDKDGGWPLAAAVGGYGAGSAIFGPLAQLGLIPAYGLPATFQILGGIFLVMTMIGALLLRNPPAGYRPDGWSPAAADFGAPGIHARRNAANAGFLLHVGGVCAGLLRGPDGDQPLVPFAKSVGIAAAALSTMTLVVGAGKCLGPNFFGLDVGPAGAHQCSAGDDRNLRGGDAGAVCGRTEVWPLYAAVFVVYWCYGTQLSVNGVAASDFWGTTERGHQLRDSVYGMGSGGNHRAAHRRGAV